MSYNTKEITSDWHFNVALGRFDGAITRIHKFSKAFTLGATLLDIWTRDHNLTYSTVPQQYYIVSNSVSDVGVKVLIAGTNSTGLYIEEQVTLNGTTPIALSGLWLRAFRIRVINGQANIGEIFISINPASITPANIEIRAHAVAGAGGRAGASFMSHFTVPIGYVALITKYLTGAPGNADIEFEAYARRGDGVFVPYTLDTLTGNSKEKDFDFLLFDEGFDLKVMALSSSAVNRSVPVTYDIYLVTKEWYDEDGTKLKNGVYLP